MKKTIIFIYSFFISITVFGQHWALKNSNTTDDIVDMYFRNEKEGFFLTNTGKLFTSSDSGESWHLIHQDNDFVDTLDRKFPTKNLAVVTTNDSIFCFASKNSSEDTFTIRLSATLASLSFNKDTIRRKVNQPQFWNNEIWTLEKVIQVLGGGNALEEYFIKGRYISASDASYIYYSDDSGRTWTAKRFTTTPLNSQPYQSFYEGSNQQIAVTNYPTTLYKSEDRGHNWYWNQPYLNAIKLFFLSPTKYLAYNFFGSTSKIYASSDAGITFNETSLMSIPKGIYSLNNDCFSIYVYGYNGMLYKSSDAGGLLSINTIKSQQAKINLYPNPSTDYILINNETNLKLKEIIIYDHAGKLVLKDEVHSYKINTSTLLPGNYTATLVSSNHEKMSIKFTKK